jgi:indolepyruvate ferredoxin oxidoreductase
LGLESEEDAKRRGISIFKVGMSYPLEATKISAWASKCEKVLIVEEKRSLVESQLKDIMYNSHKNCILGKYDESGASLLPQHGQINASSIANAVERVFYVSSETKNAATQQKNTEILQRTPYFCAGCPHNQSTKLPDSSVATAGIGCHTLAMNLDRSKTMPYTHMGAEGTHWIGMNRFVRCLSIAMKTPSIQQNIFFNRYDPEQTRIITSLSIWVMVHIHILDSSPFVKQLRVREML